MNDRLVKNVIFTFALLVSSFHAEANAKFFPPNKCPSIESIQTVGLGNVGTDREGSWYAVSPFNYFDTNMEWQFGVGIHADSQEEAIQKIQEVLLKLRIPVGPTYIYEGAYICTYCQKQDDFEGIAYTVGTKPVFDNLFRNEKKI